MAPQNKMLPNGPYILKKIILGKTKQNFGEQFHIQLFTFVLDIHVNFTIHDFLAHCLSFSVETTVLNLNFLFNFNADNIFDPGSDLEPTYF